MWSPQIPDFLPIMQSGSLLFLNFALLAADLHFGAVEVHATSLAGLEDAFHAVQNHDLCTLDFDMGRVRHFAVKIKLKFVSHRVIRISETPAKTGTAVCERVSRNMNFRIVNLSGQTISPAIK
jgi:hypothetical protein